MSEYYDMDKEVIGRFATLYAVHVDGRRAYYRINYNHSTTPEFETIIIHPQSKANPKRKQFEYGHPKRNGVTKKQGWSVDETELRSNWSE